MRMVSLVLAVFLLAFLSAAQQPQRRATPAPVTVPGAPPSGSYYALVIGINHHQDEPPLQTAVNDAKAIDTLLRERYGFQSKLLLDVDATRTNILNALGQYRRTLGENTSLLVYYAGHGTRDGDKSYWLPVDSDPDSTANWIIADDITTGARVIPARHVLIVSDSCYSGGISRTSLFNILPPDHDAAIAKMVSSRSRILISSGRDEPVGDSGRAGHSVFADALLRGLARMSEQSFTALSLFDQYVRDAVVGRSQQVPLYEVIQNSGHDGGDFVSFPRPAASVDTSLMAGSWESRLPKRTDTTHYKLDIDGDTQTGDCRVDIDESWTLFLNEDEGNLEGTATNSYLRNAKAPDMKCIGIVGANYLANFEISLKRQGGKLIGLITPTNCVLGSCPNKKIKADLSIDYEEMTLTLDDIRKIELIRREQK